MEVLSKQEAIRKLILLGELPTPEKIAVLTGESEEDEEEKIKRRARERKEKQEPKLVFDAKPVEISKTSIEDFEPKVEIIKTIRYEPSKIEVQNFVEYFRNRYKVLKNMLLNRPEAAEATSINKLAISSTKKQSVIIAMISEIKRFDTGTVKLELEDLTGKISAIISSKKPELLEETKMLTEDEVVAFSGGASQNLFFVDEIIWPDIPYVPKKQAPNEVYAAFSGDIHAGSDTFMPEQLGKFVKWLRGEYGTEEQKRIAKLTKYVFVQGDIVDGVGVYPGQQKELHVTDIYEQYDYAASFIRQIPSDKIVICCPGNHDGMRLAEPQPALLKDYAAPFYDLPNVINVSNPALLNIHAVGDFQGYKVLMYHGFSFDYFLDKVEGLRNAGGYEAPDKIMEFLLKRRHLAPSHGATLALPTKEDHLLINQVPDIFATGHIHKAKIAKYKGVLTIAGSCWQRNTSFQDRVGIKADPAKVPVVNLQTGGAKVLHFD